MKKYDSIIFDLDGTLWDSVNSVVDIWNNALIKAGIEPTMNYNELSKCMGLQIEQIFDKVIPQATYEQRRIVKQNCLSSEVDFLSVKGGILYKNLEDTLSTLKKSFPLFIVSNCQDGYINAFFTAHDTKKYFDDYECAGRTGKSKGENIKILCSRHNLKKPVYVGDTVMDFTAAEYAGIDFIHAAYGFGEVENAKKINTFAELIELTK